MFRFLRTIDKRIFQRLGDFSKVPNVMTVFSSPVNRIKEVHETREGKTLTVEAAVVPSEREKFMVKTPHIHSTDGNDPCPICRLNLNIKHTDVLILSQFVRSDGCMLPRRITGLCRMQQKRIGTMVTMAQKAGLMPNLAPSYSKKDPKKRYKWKKFNTYFDESTILYRKRPTQQNILSFKS